MLLILLIFWLCMLHTFLNCPTVVEYSGLFVSSFFFLFISFLHISYESLHWHIFKYTGSLPSYAHSTNESFKKECLLFLSRCFFLLVFFSTFLSVWISVYITHLFPHVFYPPPPTLKSLTIRSISPVYSFWSPDPFWLNCFSLGEP